MSVLYRFDMDFNKMENYEIAAIPAPIVFEWVKNNKWSYKRFKQYLESIEKWQEAKGYTTGYSDCEEDFTD